MTSFQSFVTNEFHAKSDCMKAVYGSAEAFRKFYLTTQGLAPYLETLRGTTPSLGLTNNLVKTYIEECKRTPEEIPSLLASLSRTYEIEIPAEEGILTGEYWQQKAEQFHWTNARMENESD